MKYFFETIKCEDSEVFNLHYHQLRISKTIGLNIDLQEYIYPPTNHLLRAKVVYSQNGIEKIDYFKYTPKNIKIFKIIEDDTIEYKYKYLNRENIDKLYTKIGIADEILIVKNGLLTDTSIANIALFINGKWLTPKKPLLEGTTRSRLLEEKTIFEADLTLEDIKLSSKIALLNAMIGFKEIKDYTLLY
jgi:4-amino-4-deoxychorismate lyase